MENEEPLSNFGLMKCYYLITSINDIKKNPGFYIPLFGLVFLIVIIIMFIFKGYNVLSQRIDEAIKFNFHYKNNKNFLKSQENNKKYIIININKYLKDDITNNSSNSKKKKKNSSIKLEQRIIKRNKTKKCSKKTQIGSKNSFISNQRNSKKNSTNFKVNISNKLNDDNDIIINQNEEDNIFIYENDYDISMINFETALKSDKRTFFEYYCSLIRNKQIFLFSFCDYNSYNSSIIKKLIFILSFIYHYGINAFFFLDSTMYQIYLDEGNYNIPIQFPYALASAVISTALIRLLCLLINTENNILEVKNQENEKIANIKKQGLLRNIKIKFSIFFLLNILFLLFFWFYLLCFNAVYLNTQITLCINTLFSFSLSNIYPILVNLIPAFFRIDIIQNKRQKKTKLTKTEIKDAEYIYKLSQTLQNALS